MTSIIIRTVIIYILLSLSLRIMGKRQLGELDVSELVSTLLISEIASIPIDDPDIPLLNAIIPILFIVSVEVILSTLKNKSEISACLREISSACYSSSAEAVSITIFKVIFICFSWCFAIFNLINIQKFSTWCTNQE